jgi:hypothetical protein
VMVVLWLCLVSLVRGGITALLCQQGLSQLGRLTRALVGSITPSRSADMCETSCLPRVLTVSVSIV